MKIALSTDTSCTISKDLAKKLNIFLFPLNVIIDGIEYLDGISITQDELNIAMRGGKTIKTSTPPPSDIINYFNDIFNKGYDKIIHFTISSKLSSMNSLFNNISHDEFNDRIIVIDSYAVCSLMLSHVFFAYDEINNGTSPERIKELVSERTNDSFVYFVPENLTALKNGGRISPAIANLGNLIGLKPVLLLKDGALAKDEMVRNIKKSVKTHIENCSSKYPIEKYDYSLVSFDGKETTITSILTIFHETFKDYNIHLLPIAINVCAHCGPGTIGLIISPKINGKSINEFLDL